MEYEGLARKIECQTLSRLFEKYPFIKDFFSGIRVEHVDPNDTLSGVLNGISEEYLEDFGLTRERIGEMLARLVADSRKDEAEEGDPVRKLTVVRGRDKSGKAENGGFTVRRGEISAVVGPTGSGKSRLLGDIECLAQQDTPTGRRILVNGKVPGDAGGFPVENRLISQISQNMNFVMDLTVAEFLSMHAQSRMALDPDGMIEEVFRCANSLSGEPFSLETAVTQLSGGQARALMIADTAVISDSPIVLIDEIENAGIDRRSAVRLLAEREKIVFLSTHDPLLALSADRRIVIRNGGISKVIKTSGREKSNALEIEREDRKMTELRNSIRLGKRLEFDMKAYFRGEEPPASQRLSETESPAPILRRGKNDASDD